MARTDYTGWLDDRSLLASRGSLDAWLTSGKGGRLQTVNLQHMYLMDHDDRFRQVSEAADFHTADGFPVVMVASKLLSRDVERVTGSDLVRDVIEGRPELPGRRWALFGSSSEGAERLGAALAAVGQELAVVDTGMVRDWDPAELVRRCDEAGVTSVLVAVSQPSTEYVARAVAQADPRLQVLGVGAGVDMAVGLVDRAPTHWARWRLEWLWRFAAEPRRMFRRYFVEGIPFFVTKILPLVLGRTVPRPVVPIDQRGVGGEKVRTTGTPVTSLHPDQSGLRDVRGSSPEHRSAGRR